MIRSFKVFGISSLVVVCILLSAVWFNPSHSASAQSPLTPPSAKPVIIPRQTKAMGPYTVKGNATLGWMANAIIFMVLGVMTWNIVVGAMEISRQKNSPTWGLAPRLVQ